MFFQIANLKMWLLAVICAGLFFGSVGSTHAKTFQLAKVNTEVFGLDYCAHLFAAEFAAFTHEYGENFANGEGDDLDFWTSRYLLDYFSTYMRRENGVGLKWSQPWKEGAKRDPKFGVFTTDPYAARDNDEDYFRCIAEYYAISPGTSAEQKKFRSEYVAKNRTTDYDFAVVNLIGVERFDEIAYPSVPVSLQDKFAEYLNADIAVTDNFETPTETVFPDLSANHLLNKIYRGDFTSPRNEIRDVIVGYVLNASKRANIDYVFHGVYNLDTYLDQCYPTGRTSITRTLLQQTRFRNLYTGVETSAGPARRTTTEYYMPSELAYFVRANIKDAYVSRDSYHIAKFLKKYACRTREYDHMRKMMIDAARSLD
jgi:hypothetical protein